MPRKPIVAITKEQEVMVAMHEELIEEVKELQSLQRKTNKLLEQLLETKTATPSVPQSENLKVNIQKSSPTVGGNAPTGAPKK